MNETGAFAGRRLKYNLFTAGGQPKIGPDNTRVGIYLSVAHGNRVTMKFGEDFASGGGGEGFVIDAQAVGIAPFQLTIKDIGEEIQKTIFLASEQAQPFTLIEVSDPCYCRDPQHPERQREWQR